MHNFVALEEENEWLRHLDVDIINARLEDRRRRHVQLMAEGSYFSLSDVCATVRPVAEGGVRVHMCKHKSCTASQKKEKSDRTGNTKTCTVS
jgi:hypothetical protein